MELSLNNLKRKPRRHRRRVGRGNSSGRGSYSGRGQKGQKSRSGGNIKPGFEGGRMPLIRQIPKSRGFKSWYEKPEVVNLNELDKNFKNDELVNALKLKAKGLIRRTDKAVKILGEGNLTKKLTIEADLFSKTAKDAIKKAGGEVKIKQK